jgi:truncated hemoglobin YjbI
MLSRKTNQEKHHSVGSIASIVFSVLLILIAVMIWFNRQYVVDWISYVQYKPTETMQSFATRTTMTDTGKFYFYVSHPSLEKTQNFNKYCDRKESGSAVLGCYSTGKIYVYDISDQRLDGIREVTSAHEMLHAAYDRLNETDKKEVDRLVEAEYEKHKNDPELAERMAFYERTQPGERDNELHSIIGTEFTEVSQELEQHYKKYFQNRQVVVQLHDHYADLFNSLKKQAADIAAQLKALTADIEAASQEYNVKVAALNKSIESFNARASAGDFETRAQFNEQRQQLLNQVRELEKTRTDVSADTDRYEQLRTQYNELADASQELYNSIDSRLAPAPSL